MENTEQLRNWIKQKVESEYHGNLTAFSENTTVSRQTWMNILINKYKSLRQQAVSDLCQLYNLSEIELYRIAHPELEQIGQIQETAPEYRIRDETERLADFIRKTSEKDREFIYSAAERCGFRRNKNNRSRTTR